MIKIYIITSSEIINRTFLKQLLHCFLLNFKNLLLFFLITLGLVDTAFGHTVDSVDEYRLEIGWMN